MSMTLLVFIFTELLLGFYRFDNDVVFLDAFGKLPIRILLCDSTEKCSYNWSLMRWWTICLCQLVEILTWKREVKPPDA